MKPKNRLILKQSLKYFFIILIAFLAVSLYRIIYSLPSQAFYWMVGAGALILIISIIMDAISTKDILPIFKG